MSRMFDWMIDYVYLLRGSTVMYIKRKPPKHYLEHIVEGKYPIILLPGMTIKWGFMRGIGNMLSLLGHPVYIVPKIGYNMAEVPKAALIVEEIIKENKLKNVIIVAHSKGGLVGKYLLIHANTEKEIKAVIALATPFSGTKLAKLVPYKAFRELYPDSAIIKDLATHTEVNKDIISIAPIFDNHIWSKAKCYLEGADNIEVPIRGHHKILFDRSIQEKIIKCIDKICSN